MPSSRSRQASHSWPLRQTRTLKGKYGQTRTKHPAEVPVLDVEVVLLDETVEELDVIALAGES